MVTLTERLTSMFHPFTSGRDISRTLMYFQEASDEVITTELSISFTDVHNINLVTSYASDWCLLNLNNPSDMDKHIGNWYKELVGKTDLSKEDVKQVACKCKEFLERYPMLRTYKYK